MAASEQQTATAIAGELASGDRQRAPELAQLVYDNLRRYAAAAVGGPANERPDGALQPTALVHEAYLRLVDQSRVDWAGRTHFFAVGAEMIRRVLVDEARRHGAAKRGGGWRRMTLGAAEEGGADSSVDLLNLDEALAKLGAVDPRAARVVELRFFGGLREEDVAAVLGVSPSTVRDDWRMARAWLREALSGAGDGG